MSDNFKLNESNPVSKVLFWIIVFLVIVYSTFIVLNKDNVLFSPDNIPIINSVILLSGSNLTSDILSGWCNPQDADLDDENLTCFYEWYLEGVLEYSGNSNCVSGNDNNIANLSGEDLVPGNWILSCKAFDNYNYSDSLNSSSLFIDSFPEIIFNYPTSLGALRQDFIILNISSKDVNPDTLIINLSNSSGEIFSSFSSLEVFTNITNLSEGVYTLTARLNDSLGNVNETIKTIYLDFTRPVLSLNHIPLSYGDGLDVSIIANDNLSGIECIRFTEGNNPYFNLSCSGQLTNISFIPLGFHWINLTAIDFAGNYNSGSFYVSVAAQGDVFPPVVSNLTKNISENLVILNWETNENTDSRIYYGTNLSSLSSTSYSATRVLSHSFRLENLLNSTFYHFNITNCDSSGNCVYFISNFTTSSAIIEDDDEEEEPLVFSVSYSSLSSGYEKQNLVSGDSFSISRSSGEKYNLTLVSVGSNSIRLRVNNLPSFLVNSGSTQLIDTNSDSTNDLEVSVLNISEGKVKIRLKYFSQQVYTGVGNAAVNNTGGEIPSSEDEESSLPYIIWSLIILFVLAIVVLLYFKKKEIVSYFSSKKKSPSEIYTRIWGLVHQADSLIVQGKKDQAKSIYVTIRNLYSSLSSEEKVSLKPRLLNLYSSLR